MSAGEDGGAAFPAPGDEEFPREWGMSLRDYFAAQALAGLLHHYHEGRAVSTDPFNDISEVAYEYADAMLEARKR